MVLEKYKSIAEKIYERINHGVYPINSLLPPQNELAEEFNVSRLTVKRALDSLGSLGIVTSQRGSGTRVIKSANILDGYPANNHDGLTAILKNKNLTTKVIEFQTIDPDEFLQEKLVIDAKTKVYEIRRLRLINDEPLVLEHTYIPVDLVPNLSIEILQNSLYQYLKGTLELKFAGAYRTIQAAKPNKYDIAYLSCTKNDPVLDVVQSIYLPNGRIVEYSSTRNRYDNFKYTIFDALNEQN